MKRNSGIIGDKIETTVSETKGLHDIYDQHTKNLSNDWPKALEYAAVTGNGTTINEGAGVGLTVFFRGGVVGDNLPYEITTVSGTTMTNADFTGAVITGGTISLVADSTYDTQFVFNPVLVSTDGTENNTFKVTVYRGSPVSSDNIIFDSNTFTVNDVTGLDQTFDLVVSSAPTGITITSGASISSGFSSTYGFMTGGNATGFSYPLSLTDSHTGNRLFQATVAFPTNCTDPSIAMWIASNGRNYMQWNWATTNSRGVSLQTNCMSYPMLNTPSGGQNGSAIANGAIGNTITMHLWHHQTAGVMRAKITLGADDWAITGTQLGGTTTPLSKAYSTTAAVYFGLSSDLDGVSLGSGSCNYKKLRIRDSNTWVAP